MRVIRLRPVKSFAEEIFGEISSRIIGASRARPEVALVLALKDSCNSSARTLWFCLATPGIFRWNTVTQDLVNKSAKKLVEALRQNGRSK